MSATEDLLYIAQRVKGITDLIPLLQEIESLDNYKLELDHKVKEAQEQLTGTKSIHEGVLLSIEEASSNLKAIEHKIIEDQKKHDHILKSIENLKSKF